MSKIICLFHDASTRGGTETSLLHVASGLRELGHEVELAAGYASATPAGNLWAPEIAPLITLPIPVRRVAKIEEALSDADGIVLSLHNITSSRLRQVIMGSENIAPWVVGRHWSVISNPALIQFREMKEAPKWCGRYVSFWEEAELIEPDSPWTRTILPYAYDTSRLTERKPFKYRPYDFVMACRAESKKGIMAHCAAIEGLVQRGHEDVRARIAGSPAQMPGGPYIHTVRQTLEKWGWKVENNWTGEGPPKMWTPWTATKNGSTIDYTGSYSRTELWDILDSGIVYANLSLQRAYGSHLEYSTMEAMNAGNVVLASTDYAPWHYDDTTGIPDIVPVPRATLAPKRGDRDCVNNGNPDSYETTYKDLVDTYETILTDIREDVDGLDAQARDAQSRNQDVLTLAHDPKIAAQAYLDALAVYGTKEAVNYERA